jgi:hypothetical protein
MSATLTLYEFIGTTLNPTTATNLNLGSTVAGNLNSTLYPITVGTYSQSKVLQLSFAGSFTSISGIKIYQSAGTNVTGQVTNYGCSPTFHTSTGGSYADTVATTAMPTSLPGSANITVGGTTTYTITTTQNTTDYLFLQSSLSVLVSATTVPTATLTVTWTEVA